MIEGVSPSQTHGKQKGLKNTLGGTAGIDTTRIPPTDPEILPGAKETSKKVDTLEGFVADISLDFSLPEEEEENNISGKKELREEGDTNDENNSKRPKVPLGPINIVE